MAHLPTWSRSTKDKPPARKEEGGVEGNDRLPAQDDEYPHGIRLFFIIISLAVSVFLVGLDGTIVSTAIPTIVDQFHSLQDVGWYGSVFFLTVSMNAVWGKAYKYSDLKLMFLIAILIFELGSLICGVAPNSVAFIVGRAIAGLGGAGIQSGAYTIAGFSAPVAKRPAFVGAMGACYGVASAIGPLIGGALTSNVTWRWCFYLNLPIGGTAALIILLGFRTPAKAKPPHIQWLERILQMNPVGVVFYLGGMICYLLAMQYGGQTYPWHSPVVIGLLVGAGVLLITFFTWEQFQGERALLQPRLFRIRAIAAACPFNFFVTGVYSSMTYFIPLFFQGVQGYSAVQSGIRTLPLVLSVSLFLVGTGIFLRKFGYHKPLLICGSALAAVGAGLIYTWGGNVKAGKWIGYQILLGVGVGMSGQGSLLASQAAVHVSDLAATTSLVLFFQTVGGAFFISAAEAAFANKLKLSLMRLLPGSDASSLFEAGGGANVRTLFSDSQLQAVLQAYIEGLHTAYLLALTSGGIAFLLSFFAEWKKINMDSIAAPGPAPSGDPHTEKPKPQSHQDYDLQTLPKSGGQNSDSSISIPTGVNLGTSSLDAGVHDSQPGQPKDSTLQRQQSLDHTNAWVGI